MRNFLIGLLAVVAVACTPAKAETLKELGVSVVTHQGTHYVVGYWKNATVSDGLGPITAVLSWDKIGTDSTGHTLSPTAVKDSFAFTATVGVQVSGQFCIRAQRRALFASSSCKAWTFTEQDQPPPPSTIDSVTTAILQMTWPDSGSIALMKAAFSDALPRGPIIWVRGPDTLYVNEWGQWGEALLLMPGANCNADCEFNLVADTNKNSFAYSNWIEVRHEALMLATSPKHREWWDSTKACGGCAYYLPFDSTLPGAKT